MTAISTRSSGVPMPAARRGSLSPLSGDAPVVRGARSPGACAPRLPAVGLNGLGLNRPAGLDGVGPGRGRGPSSANAVPPRRRWSGCRREPSPATRTASARRNVTPLGVQVHEGDLRSTPSSTPWRTRTTAARPAS